MFNNLEQGYSDDGVRDIQFQTKIARNEDGIKVRLGHISPPPLIPDILVSPDTPDVL